MFFWTGATLPLSGHAETNKEGTDSYTDTWVSSGPNSLKIGDRTVGTYELIGVHHNDSGGDNMGLRCLGAYEIAGAGIVHGHGACIYADQAGDQIMTTYEDHGNDGTETLVSGTGKFAGISGTGEYTILQRGLHADDKVARGVVAEKIHWKLP
jgi:hypothetical protein